MNKLQQVEKQKQTFLKEFEDFQYNEEQIEKFLSTVLSAIEHLEKIYQTRHFLYCSKVFKDNAYAERERLCIESSALYDILREHKQKNK